MNYGTSDYPDGPGNNSDDEQEAPVDLSQNIVTDIADVLQHTWWSAQLYSNCSHKLKIIFLL